MKKIIDVIADNNNHGVIADKNKHDVIDDNNKYVANGKKNMQLLVTNSTVTT